MRKKINKDIILFYGISLVWSIILGMLQYFLWSHLQNHGITLEKIAGYISFGMTAAYLVGGALSRTFKKRNLSIFFSIVSIVSVSFFFFFGRIPLDVFMVLTSIIGFSYGIWAVIKHIILSFEIQHSGIRETVINGILSICTIIGALVGSYMGIKIFEWWGVNGYFLIIGFMLISLLLSIPLKYDHFFRKKSFNVSFKAFLPEVKKILKQYYWLLLPIGMIWSISIGFAQKVFYLGINMFSAAPEKAIFIYLYSVIGAVLGFVISAIFYKKKKLFVIVSTIIMAISLGFFLRLVSRIPKYTVLSISSTILGVLFGILINILEGRYFWHIGKNHDKEYGAAVYGIVVSVLNFFMMIFADFLIHNSGIKSTFAFFGIILFISLFFYKHFDKEHYSFDK